MKKNCEKCEKPIASGDTAYICVYECSFCPACAEQMQHVCPNCGGELVRRPRAGKIKRQNELIQRLRPMR